MEASLFMTLKDGRLLGYQEYGCPEGYPVLYFHGLPSSCLEGSITDTTACQRNLRIITLDRPGFGISTFQENRQIIDYLEDVKILVAHLELKRFAIVGFSGGGPYALACAHLLPRGMVSSVGLLSTCGPCDQGLEGIPVPLRIGIYGIHVMPRALVSMACGMASAAEWLLGTGKEQEHTQTTYTANREQQPFEGLARRLNATFQELQILIKHWGFDLENLDYSPIHIWHGTDDANASFQWIQRMAQRIPQSKLIGFHGESHESVVKHLEFMFTQLVPNSI